MAYGFDDYDDGDEERDDFVTRARATPTCNRCGSTAVRWRQQTGQWVLFDLQAGVVHSCTPMAGADEFA